MYCIHTHSSSSCTAALQEITGDLLNICKSLVKIDSNVTCLLKDITTPVKTVIKLKFKIIIL